jgi:hypothetical protein
VSSRITGFLVACVLATAWPGAAQSSARRATNIAALLAHSGFYHQRAVVVVGDVAVVGSDERRVSTEAGALRVVFTGNSTDGVSEVRGEFWDLGRMNADDPRLAAYDVRKTFGIDPDGSWPRPGQVLALIASSIAPAQPPLSPSVRNLVLTPERFLDEKVTVTGQFGGRNILGDLPDAPAQSRYDFVIRTADAAIWVANIQPRGRDFQLALDSRIDTGRWVQVTGTLQQGRGLLWLNGEPNSLALAKPPAETPPEEPIRVPAAPAPEVVFSAPLDGETDVATGTNLRIQFSRDINAATFKARVHVRYMPRPARADEAATEIPFTTTYLPGNRVLEIRFAQRLEPFRTVRVELGDGITGSDGQPLTPTTLTFTTGSGS